MMRIQNLRQQRSGVPLIGKVFKGGKKTGNRPGPDLDYFRLEVNDSDFYKANEVANIFAHLYGNQPRSITNIQLMSDRVDDVFPTVYEAWAMSKQGRPFCTHRCDGEKATLWTDQDGSIQRGQKPCDGQTCGAKPTGRLIFWLPEVLQLKPESFGNYMLVTHSMTDISNILAALDFTVERFGRLQGIPFRLSRYKETIQTPDGLPVDKWLVRLEVMPVVAQHMALEASQSAAMLPMGNPKALPENAPNGYGSAPRSQVVEVIEEVDGELIDDETGEGEVHDFYVHTVERARSQKKSNVTWFELVTNEGPVLVYHGSRDLFVEHGVLANKEDWSEFRKPYKAAFNARAVYTRNSKGELYWKMTEITDIPF